MFEAKVPNIMGANKICKLHIMLDAMTTKFRPCYVCGLFEENMRVSVTHHSLKRCNATMPRNKKKDFSDFYTLF